MTDARALEPTASEWLVRLRWGAFASQLLLVVTVDRCTDIALPLRALLVILSVGAATNVALQARVSRHAELPNAVIAIVLATDMVLLTAMLMLTGGPFNPFSALYLVYIALAPVVLDARWTSGLVAFSIACFAGLFRFSEAIAQKAGATPLDHAMQMRIHMQGMWIAFTVAALLIGVFVRRVRVALEAQRHALAEAQAKQARTDKLSALGTLAAGAAHELSTPLATIALIARELERALLARPSEDRALIDDATTIRAEVERCRAILEQMSIDAGAGRGDALAETSASAIVEAAIEALPAKARVVTSIDGDARDLSLRWPVRAVGMALKGLVKNALDASPEAATIDLRAAYDGAFVALSVVDRGSGMSANDLSRAMDPFFTTKPVGRGMGLGLFLARAVAEQLGGSLTLTSTLGTGTTATLLLPREMRART